MKTEMMVLYPCALFCGLPAHYLHVYTFNVGPFSLGIGPFMVWSSFDFPDSDDLAIAAIRYVFLPFLIINLIVVIFLLLRNQYAHLRTKTKIEVLEKQINEGLVDLIFSKNGMDSLFLKVRAFKNSIPFHEKWCRNYILDKILNLSQSYQVDPERHLEIFKLFGFYEKSQKLLRHRKWYYRSLGIYRVQRIMDDSKKTEIRRFLYDKNPELKSNALMALVTLSPQRFGALCDFDEPLTKAEEMKILDTIHQSSPHMPKNTPDLLESKNTSIVILGIKLMVLYKESFSFEQIKRLAWFSNFRIRREAVKAVGKLGMEEANTLLLDLFDVEHDKRAKINILKSLKKVGSRNAARFLQARLEKEKDTDLVFEMIDCIHTLDPNFFEDLLAPLMAQDKVLEGIALHVKDPYLV
ncbi:MAG: HEAT repeat domain-containing protein [Bacteroidota bacterium]